LSVVIMHHPSRAEFIPDLLKACAPLEVRVIEDPDPTGPPSALRTAKVAWAAVQDGATHHLVLQDDVVPVPGFAEQIVAAIEARPSDGVTLYVNWDSPHNSYVVRRAALAGSAWAPLSPDEWIPTLGLALPADQARGLAARLGELADDSFWGDDDEAIAAFFSDKGLRIACTIPGLVDHTDVPSLAGNDLLGSRRGTVLCASSALAPDHWKFRRDPIDRYELGRKPEEHVVELRNSRCAIRFVRPGTPKSPRPGGGEFLEQPFAWYWYDWAGLVGIDPEQVIAQLEKFLQPGNSALPVESLELPVVTEVWAAGYLLGADPVSVAARSGRSEDEAGLSAVQEAAFASWIDSGLLERPAADVRAAYVELCAAGYRRGLADSLERA
jgi:hypothetical protein